MAAKGTRSSSTAGSESKLSESKLSESSPVITATLKELEELISRSVKKLFEEFKEDFRREIKTLFDNHEKRIKDLEADLNTKTEMLLQLDTKVDKLPSGSFPNIEDFAQSSDLDAVRKVARDALVQANDNEQYSRRNNIRIRGLPIPDGSNGPELVSTWIGRTLGLPDVTASDIAAAHRLPARTGKLESVIVRFQNRQVRDRVIKARKSLKNTAYSIADDLTSLNLSLITRLKADDRIQDAWSWQGKIKVKRSDNKIVNARPFQTVDELYEL